MTQPSIYLHVPLLSQSLNIDVLNTLMFQPTCDTEARNSTLLTPFLISVASGSLKVLERLVSYGVDITAVDEDGDTALHLVIRNKNPSYELPDEKSPEMKKVTIAVKQIILLCTCHVATRA